jgi:hypothetical protein
MGDVLELPHGSRVLYRGQHNDVLCHAYASTWSCQGCGYLLHLHSQMLDVAYDQRSDGHSQQAASVVAEPVFEGCACKRNRSIRA